MLLNLDFQLDPPIAHFTPLYGTMLPLLLLPSCTLMLQIFVKIQRFISKLFYFEVTFYFFQCNVDLHLSLY